MYSRSLATLLYAVATILFASLLSAASAMPTDLTIGDVISHNRNMACQLGRCMVKNGTNSTGPTAAAVNSSDSSDPTPAANGAPWLHENIFVLPALMAGTSLLLLL